MAQLTQVVPETTVFVANTVKTTSDYSLLTRIFRVFRTGSCWKERRQITSGMGQTQVLPLAHLKLAINVEHE